MPSPECEVNQERKWLPVLLRVDRGADPASHPLRRIRKRRIRPSIASIPPSVTSLCAEGRPLGCRPKATAAGLGCCRRSTDSIGAAAFEPRSNYKPAISLFAGLFRPEARMIRSGTQHVYQEPPSASHDDVMGRFLEEAVGRSQRSKPLLSDEHFSSGWQPCWQACAPMLAGSESTGRRTHRHRHQVLARALASKARKEAANGDFRSRSKAQQTDPSLQRRSRRLAGPQVQRPLRPTE